MSIAKVLGANQRHDGYMEGNGYQVTWALGHLCELNAPGDYHEEWKHWKLDALPMVPDTFEVKLIDDKGVKAQFQVIKKLFSKATTIINCGDAGQEGELIQRWIQQKTGVVNCPVQRLWVSSLTDEAIQEGFRHLRPQSDFENLYLAGLARAIADWLLGMNATRLYTIKYGGYGMVLSIGRVQTPTLAMVVDRTKAIKNLVPKPYWVLSTVYRGINFTAVDGRFDTEQAANEQLAKINSQPFVIKDVQQKNGREAAPQLYDLTALQVDCNKRYGYSAEKTLNTLQHLYEKKLTTYPRVDTRFLSDDIYPKCSGILSTLTDYSEFTRPLQSKPLPKSSRVFNTAKVTDHHAIIPTGQHPDALSTDEQHVYDLICRRFIAVFLPDCLFSTTTVLACCGDVQFKATGKEIIDFGWRRIYGNSDDEGDKVVTLPTFLVGDSGFHSPKVEQKMTTPPKAYTDATLLQAMETAGKTVEDETLREAMKENGIGRPSSRASIIEKLIKVGYLVRNGKTLEATTKGIELIDLIQEPLLKSCETTGRWEKILRDIEKGTYSMSVFIADLVRQLRALTDRIKRAPSATLHATPPTTYHSSSRKSTSRTARNKPFRRKR